ESQEMRFVIMGAGAIGGAIAARLAQSNAEVVVIARGLQYEKLRAEGLLLKTPSEQVRVRPATYRDAAEVPWRDDDVILLSVKTQDTLVALHSLEAAGAARLPIFCAQNGVENERLAGRIFGRVYGMLVMLPASFGTPGEVTAVSEPVTGVLHAGRFPEGSDETSIAVCKALAS